MTPLPGYKVIPDGWAEHHRPTAESTMTADASILRASAGPPPYPLPPGWTGETTIWTGKVRLQELKRDAFVLPGEQPTQTRRYLVTAPVAAPMVRAGENGDTVAVLGGRYKIIQRMSGSLLWELDMIVEDNLTQQNP